MRAKADLLVAATSIASRLWSYYDEGPEGLFREPPVSSDGFLWWQTPGTNPPDVGCAKACLTFHDQSPFRLSSVMKT